MQSKPSLNPSTVLFIAKLKNFLDCTGLTFDEFLQNFQTMKTSQLTSMEFYRIVSLLHIQRYNNFDPQKVFQQLSRGKEAILIHELKKLISMIGAMLNDRKQGEDKAREEEMKKKVVKIGTHKLQEFINHHPNPILFFVEYDLDKSGAISKVEFCRMLVATDIKEFVSKDIRKMLVDFIYKYYPKGEITIEELAHFFKIPYEAPKQPQSAKPKLSAQDPFKKKKSPQNNNNLEVPKGNQNQFLKKQENPYLSPNGNNKAPIVEYPEIRMSNAGELYPLAIKYMTQEPEPSLYGVLEQMETLLKKNQHFIDNQNPKITEGTYTRAADIFQEKFYIFQMAHSILMREKSRIGIAQEIQPKDIIQGSVGDCYFLSSIASIISLYPELIADLFLLNVNPADLYALKLFIDGQWKIITTDDRFPCQSNRPIYAKPHHCQIWVMLLEKCWAKIFGSYKGIESGSSKEGFIALTGAPCDLINQEKQEDQASILKKLQVAYQKRYVATMSGSSYLQSLGKKGEEQFGLISGHAYSMLKFININGEIILKLRNPWGKLIWKGDWSFESKKWTKELRDRYNYNKNPEDGSFYMCWKDFKKFFGEIIICKLNASFLHDSIRFKTNRHKSGYFLMKVSTAGQYIVSIYQENKRKMSQQFSNYQYSQARIIIMKREGKKLTYVGSKSTSSYHVCSADVQLEEGEYIISAKVVWKFWEEHEYVLTSYGGDHVTLEPINRQIAPLFKENLIKSYSTIMSGTGKVKNYEKYNFNATCETNFSLQTGIGFIKMVNKSDKGFESVQDFELKGIKIIKPDKLPLQFKMEPKSQKVYGFFVSPMGFQYSNTQRIKY